MMLAWTETRPIPCRGTIAMSPANFNEDENKNIESQIMIMNSLSCK